MGNGNQALEETSSEAIVIEEAKDDDAISLVRGLVKVEISDTMTKFVAELDEIGCDLDIED